MKHDPRLYVQSAWRHPNDQRRNYDFRTTDGEQRLWYLLDDHGPLNPNVWGGINVLLMARGLLKTTALQMILNWAFQFYGPMGFESYQAAPREGQIREFSEKFSEKIEWSGLHAKREKDALEHQKFRFEVDEQPVYAHHKADSGWGEGDAMRGPHSHLGVYDEFQDASKRSFNAGFYEVIDQSIAGVPYFPVIFIMGTPKMEGSFFEDIWNRSDQREWVPSRGDRGEWVAQSNPRQYGHGDDARLVRGWHVTQRDAPLHSEAEIAAKRDLKDEQEFKNEVLAEFYSPEDHLLSRRHLKACANDELGLVTERRHADAFVTIGVDWGGGDDRNAADTVIIVMEHTQFDADEGSVQDTVTRTYIDDVTFVPQDHSKDEEFHELEERIIQFDADEVVVDDGYGSKRREDLQKGNYTMDPDGYRQLVDALRFGNVSSSTRIKWKDDDAKLLATADKTHFAKSFVDFVKSGRLVIPTADLNTSSNAPDTATGKRLYEQLTAPYEERRETSAGKKKATITSKRSTNDDAFDAGVYAWMGYHADILGPTSTHTEFRTISAPGV